MKIIYSGGYNRRDWKSVLRSGLFRRAIGIWLAALSGKKVVIVTLAKFDGYYDKYLKWLILGWVEKIDSAVTEVDWGKYDYILVLGGNQQYLKENMDARGFSINKLKENVTYFGDSAGAYVMGRYFPSTDDTDVKGIEISKLITEGYVPQSNLLVVAHANNPRYCPPEMKEFAHGAAKGLGVELLLLEENQEFILELPKREIPEA